MYIADHIDQYFDMNSMQSLFVKKAVKEDIDKIKTEIFPGVAAELDRIELLIKSKTAVSSEQISRSHTEFKKIFYEGLKIFEPSAQKFVQKLSNDQIETFKKEFKKKSLELAVDLENPDGAIEKRFDVIRNQIEIWIGSLTIEQRLLVQNFTKVNVLPLKELIHNREKLSKEFLDSFKSSADQRKFINTLFTNYESMLEPAYRRAAEFDLKKYFELIASVLNKLEPKQRNHLIVIISERSQEMKKMFQDNQDKKEKVRLTDFFPHSF